MKKPIIILVWLSFTYGTFGQCNPNPEIIIPEGYELVKRVDISMPGREDTLRTYDFAMANNEEYKLRFIEEDPFKNKAYYSLYEESFLLGTNYPGGSGKMYPEFNFKCMKGKIYQLQVNRLSDESYCGYCILLKKEKEADRENNMETGQVAEDEIFFIVESMPVFLQGKGFDAFNEWVAGHVEYPEEAAKKGMQGRVFVQFVVDKTGMVRDVKVIRGVDLILDREAIRVVSSSPKWYRPGSQRGRLVNIQYVVPVIFKLD